MHKDVILLLGIDLTAVVGEILAAYVTQYEKIEPMYTKYTASHYSTYLTFCKSYSYKLRKLQ